jgi:5'-3' exonuclease
VRVHLIDGTFELFRHFYAVPSHLDAAGREMGAVRGVLGSVLGLLESGATHIGVATDHVIESFRNSLWPGYKTSEGIDPSLYQQFHPLEDALGAMGVTVWPMVELEADDGLASGAAVAERDDRVTQILLCTPDKDLAQCVRGNRTVQLDRRKNALIDEAGVIARFGIEPSSIPDYLALVGDSADGFPGLPAWGAKSASTVLARYRHIEAIPDDPATWAVEVRGKVRLAQALAEQRDRAALFKDLATLRTHGNVGDTVDDWRWRGPGSSFATLCDHLGVPALARRAELLWTTLGRGDRAAADPERQPGHRSGQASPKSDTSLR